MPCKGTISVRRTRGTQKHDLFLLEPHRSAPCTLPSSNLAAALSQLDGRKFRVLQLTQCVIYSTAVESHLTLNYA